MFRLTIAYSIAASWVFGWLTGVFGLMPTLLVAIILFAPAVFAKRMLSSAHATKRREYCYLGVATLLAITATVFLVNNWYRTGEDQRAIFFREYNAFHKHVTSQPKYKNVTVSYAERKGTHVYLNGYVTHKKYHDSLIQTHKQMLRQRRTYTCYDNVKYPGKPTADISPTNNE